MVDAEPLPEMAVPESLPNSSPLREGSTEDLSARIEREIGPATPMMRQYLEIKAQHPDAILFFRLGDFYEMFFEDAVKASELLQIALTSRSKGDERVPMCGVPYHAGRRYIAKLIEHGLRVAICEQRAGIECPSCA